MLGLVAAAVREEITCGAIAPGERLDCQDIAARHGLAGTGPLVNSALACLHAEGIVYNLRNHRSAAPAGPPDLEASARLGAELRRYREEAGLTVEELAAARPVLLQYWGASCAHRSGGIRAAEAGEWHERAFWAEL